MEGLLNKYTNVVKGWQYRWFVMDAESGMLEYFEVSSYVIIFPESEECLNFSPNNCFKEDTPVRLLMINYLINFILLCR